MWQLLRKVSGAIGPRPNQSTSQTEILARYRHLRQEGIQLNNKLVATLPTSVIDEGGKKLGILKKGILVLDTEDEIAVLMDYCIYDVRRGGLNAVERYVEKNVPEPDSDEGVLLRAMLHARYSLLVVEGREPGIGVHARDLLRDEPMFVVDVGFSRSASVDLVVATRVFAPDGITITTGACLPLGVLSPEMRSGFLQDMAKVVKTTDFQDLSENQLSELAATVIRACLQRGAAERIVYVDASAGPIRAVRAPRRPRGVGRNDPCPCGSGKKWRKCCGAAKR
jgi:hypothetical protein